nr:hypothetical protein [Leptospira borgpetersenii]
MDTPGSGSYELLSALLSADAVIIPVNPSKWAIRTVKKIFKKINEALRGTRISSVYYQLFGTTQAEADRY